MSCRLQSAHSHGCKVKLFSTIIVCVRIWPQPARHCSAPVLPLNSSVRQREGQQVGVEMPFTIDPQPSEEVYVAKEYRSAHGHVFALGISNQAIYIPAQKFTVKGDPWHFKRIPLSDVIEIGLRKQRSTSIYVFSAIMIVFGAILTYWMLGPILGREEGYVSGWPIAMIVGGLLIPFISRGRQTLLVKMVKGKYKWIPQLAVDKSSRETYRQIQSDILEASRKAGIRTIEE